MIGTSEDACAIVGAASKVGYRLGNLVENKLEPIFNPAKNKYSWVDSGYLGISYQKEPSSIPSRIGNISDSYMSERVNKYLSDQKILKDKVYEQKEEVKWWDILLFIYSLAYYVLLFLNWF